MMTTTLVLEVPPPPSDATLRWTRSCPLCGRLLGKAQPLERIFCACGWEWA